MLIQVFSKWCVQTILQQIGENVIRKGITNISIHQEYPFFPVFDSSHLLFYQGTDSLAYVSFVGRFSKKEALFEFGIGTPDELRGQNQLILLRPVVLKYPEDTNEICKSFHLECERLGFTRPHPYQKTCFCLNSLQDYCVISSLVDRLLHKEWKLLQEENKRAQDKLDWLEKIIPHNF